MALIVEDGTGKVDAESYLSVADCDTYHTAQGNSGWTGTSGAKEIALRKATDYVDRLYGGTFLGTRKTTTQRLYWPRYDAWVDDVLVDSATIPRQLKEATAELALAALTEDLMPSVAAGASGISSESKSVGPLSKSQTFIGGKTTAKDYRKARMLLGALTGAGRVMRA